MINNKKQKGITLIALVVTIVVLLILAGVSIAMLRGDNGIVTKAGEASSATKEANAKEKIELILNEYQTENYDKQKELLQFLQEKKDEGKLDEVIDNGNNKITVRVDGYTYQVDQDSYTLSEKKKEEYNNDLKKLKQGDYVIYNTGVEGTGEVTCRVLYDASSPYGLQIITDDCIKRNGEYVYIPFGSIYDLKKAQNDNEFKSKFSNCDFSEWYNYETKEVEWYNNAINILNNKAMEFYNNNYVIDARCVGSDPTNKERETKETAKIPIEVIKNNDDISDDTGVKDEDDNFETDYDTLQNLNIININRHYWFASRYNEVGPVYGDSNGLVFNLRDDGDYEATYRWG